MQFCSFCFLAELSWRKLLLVIVPDRIRLDLQKFWMFKNLSQPLQCKHKGAEAARIRHTIVMHLHVSNNSWSMHPWEYKYTNPVRDSHPPIHLWCYPRAVHWIWLVLNSFQEGNSCFLAELSWRKLLLVIVPDRIRLDLQKFWMFKNLSQPLQCKHKGAEAARIRHTIVMHLHVSNNSWSMHPWEYKYTNPVRDSHPPIHLWCYPRAVHWIWLVLNSFQEGNSAFKVHLPFVCQHQQRS